MGWEISIPTFIIFESVVRFDHWLLIGKVLSPTILYKIRKKISYWFSIDLFEGIKDCQIMVFSTYNLKNLCTHSAKSCVPPIEKRIYWSNWFFSLNSIYFEADSSTNLDDYEVGKSLQVTSILSESKHWIVVQLPIAYMATNWPIRVSFFSRWFFFRWFMKFEE